MKGNGGDDTLEGGSGGDRVVGCRGDDIVNGGQGRDRVKGSLGDDTIDGGAGSDQYYGGLGKDTFVFGPDGKFDKIHDFEDGIDTVDLSAFSFAVIDDVLANARQDGLDVFIDLGGGDVVKFDDTNLAALTADDFIF